MSANNKNKYNPQEPDFVPWIVTIVQIIRINTILKNDAFAFSWLFSVQIIRINTILKNIHR